MLPESTRNKAASQRCRAHPTDPYAPRIYAKQSGIAALPRATARDGVHCHPRDVAFPPTIWRMTWAGSAIPRRCHGLPHGHARGRHMATVGVTQAAKMTGRDPSTIFRALRTGRLSYTKDEAGNR